MEQTNLRETYLGVFKRLLSETLEELSVTPRPLTSTRSIGFADGEDIFGISFGYDNKRLMISASFNGAVVNNFSTILFDINDRWNVSSKQITTAFMEYLRFHGVSLDSRIFDVRNRSVAGVIGKIVPSLPVPPPLQVSPEYFRAPLWKSPSKGE